MATIDLRILDERIRPHLPGYATPGAARTDLRACIDAPLQDLATSQRWDSSSVGPDFGA
jgi:hypothetical protein